MSLNENELPAWQERTRLLLKDDAVCRLNAARVLVIGLGGVGAYAAELICRAGVGTMTIVDGDVVAAANFNRQLPALGRTLGRNKAEVMAERLRDINPHLALTVLPEFLRDERLIAILSGPFDYVVDAIDTLSPKVYLLATCLKLGRRVVSSMGSGGKLDPGLVRIADISATYQCRLAKAVRKRLHRMGIEQGFKVVFSPEEVPDEAVRTCADEELDNQKSIVGTVSYMPALFGCYCASVVIRDLVAARP